MKRVLLAFIIISVCAFCTNFPLQQSYLFDAGVTNFTVTDTASSTVTPKSCYPGAARIRVTVAENGVPPAGTPMRPAGTTTYSALTGSTPNIDVFQNWGRPSYWCESVDATTGLPLSPRKISSEMRLPMIEPAVPAVGAFTMPLEAVGQYQFIKRVAFTVPVGGATSSIAMRIKGDNLGYVFRQPIDGKLSISINGGAWLPITTENFTAIDLAQHLGGIGSAVSLREGTLPIADGVLNVGTNNTFAVRFNGTDGVTSGGRIIDFNFQEAQKAIVNFVVSGGGTRVTVKTTGSHGYSTNDWVYVSMAPQMYAAFNGNHKITGVDADEFYYTICENHVGDVSATGCSVADDTYTVPTNQYTSGGTPTAYVARQVIPYDQFVQDDPSTWTAPPGSDAAAGGILWHGATLVVPATPFNNYQTVAKCSSCHFKDGSDLRIFGASNNSIRQRSLLHGLTGQNGDDIAAYIRSLGAVPATGRWYNPAFMSCPGMDALSVESYLAGCGSGSYLNYDEDLKGILFPGGDYSTAAPDAHFNARQIPIFGLSYLPWRQWLPPFWPGDYVFPNPSYQWTGSFLANCRDLALATVTPGDVTGYKAFNCGQSPYTAHFMLQYPDMLKDTFINKNNMARINESGICTTGGGSNCGWRAPGWPYPNSYNLQLYSAMLVTNVAIMDINYELGFIDKLADIMTAEWGASTYGYWTRGIFQSGTTFNGDVHYQDICCQGVSGTTQANILDQTVPSWNFYANGFYIVDNTMNAGNRRGGFLRPFDIGYLMNWIKLGSQGPFFYTAALESALIFQDAYDWPLPAGSGATLVSGLGSAITVLEQQHRAGTVYTPFADQTLWYEQWAKNVTQVLNRWTPMQWCADPIVFLNCSLAITPSTVRSAYWDGIAGANSIGAGIAGNLPALYSTSGWAVNQTVVTALKDAAAAVWSTNGYDWTAAMTSSFNGWNTASQGKPGTGQAIPSLPYFANCSLCF